MLNNIKNKMKEPNIINPKTIFKNTIKIKH